MICLGLDSAGKTAGVAVTQDGRLLYEVYLANGLTHSVSLMPLVKSAFDTLSLTSADIDLFGVNAGPGSFTGLRIGLSLVKGLSLPHNTPTAGVSTLYSLACSFMGEGTVLAALDARRGEVYAAMFACNNGVVTRLCEDAAMPATALLPLVQNARTPIWLMGDGAALAYTALGGISGVQMAAPAHILGHASGVCAAAVQLHQAGQSTNGDALSAEYHRLSQAQRERNERAAAQSKAAAQEGTDVQ
ncbi:MAG: tRNA (adenosine(37)-N6)-threonylcarbamoyltransferase complex dimerization subunit type 1 TsaB [Oscillospiraceae bacterium]|nr:tRNA (adenosine(37)-N6)-threonylcarbamoyltransferase complex dimerization subunit type 1 TsaB [Oscillospiraceae bacterium]